MTADDSTTDGGDGFRVVGRHPVALGFLVTVGALLAIALGAAVSSLSGVFVSVVLALFVALGLDPVVRFLILRGMRRAWATVLVALAFAGVVVGFMLLVVPTIVEQVASFVLGLPGELAAFRQSAFFAWVTEEFGASLSDLTSELQIFLSDPSNLASIGGGVFEAGRTIVGGVSSTVIVIVLTLYFLGALPSIKRALVGLAAARNRGRVGELTERITESVGGYLSGMVVLAALNAVVSLVVLSILGVPFAALLAVVALGLTLIPMVGSVLFWIVASLVSLTVSPTAAIVFAAVYLVYMQIEAYVLTPRVMAKTISMPGVLVLLGALTGGALQGLLGALLAIPVTAALLIVYREVVKPHQDAKR